MRTRLQNIWVAQEVRLLKASIALHSDVLCIGFAKRHSFDSLASLLIRPCGHFLEISRLLSEGDKGEKGASMMTTGTLILVSFLLLLCGFS